MPRGDMSDYTVIGARIESGTTSEILSRLRSFPLGRVLALDANMVCGKEHLDTAIEHAFRAFRQNANCANDLLMEIMLYASGERQISKAQEKMSLKEGGAEIALVVIGADPLEVVRMLKLRRDDEVLLCDETKLKRFGISPKEIGAVPRDKALDLVLEKVAFVDVLKH
ncbi:MAG: KEOPS complex subunit Cgi121 [Methanomassiliicoccales archaeon]